MESQKWTQNYRYYYMLTKNDGHVLETECVCFTIIKMHLLFSLNFKKSFYCPRNANYLQLFVHNCSYNGNFSPVKLDFNSPSKTLFKYLFIIHQMWCSWINSQIQEHLRNGSCSCSWLNSQIQEHHRRGFQRSKRGVIY